MTNPYATGVLVKDRHEYLVKDIERYATMAGISAHWIWTPLSQVCTPAEIDWIKKFRSHSRGEWTEPVYELVPNPDGGDPVHKLVKPAMMKTAGTTGLLLLGANADPPIELRMFGMTGALTRNFIFAQLVSVHALISMVEKGQYPDCACLFVSSATGGKGGLPSWKQALLLDMLMDRSATGKQTVMHADSLEALEADFGGAVVDFIKHNFKRLKVS